MSKKWIFGSLELRISLQAPLYLITICWSQIFLQSWLSGQLTRFQITEKRWNKCSLKKWRKKVLKTFWSTIIQRLARSLAKWKKSTVDPFTPHLYICHTYISNGSGVNAAQIRLTKWEATQLENNARWYGSGKRCRSVSNPTWSTRVLGIARRMTPFLLGRSSNRAELSNWACKLLSVNESSSEIRVRDFVPWERECSRQMQWNSSAAFSVILVWTSFT